MSKLLKRIPFDSESIYAHDVLQYHTPALKTCLEEWTSEEMGDQCSSPRSTPQFYPSVLLSWALRQINDRKSAFISSLKRKLQYQPPSSETDSKGSQLGALSRKGQGIRATRNKTIR